METLFSGLITSKLRIKILMRFFLNSDRHAYLRELAEEFDSSPSQIKSELDQMRNAALLTSRKNGRQVLFAANANHPVFNELHSMVKKALGMDRILDSIIMRLGNLQKAILIDDYADALLILMEKGLFHHSVDELNCSYCDFRHACHKDERRLNYLVDSGTVKEIYSGKRNMEKWREVDNFHKKMNSMLLSMKKAFELKTVAGRRKHYKEIPCCCCAFIPSM